MRAVPARRFHAVGPRLGALGWIGLASLVSGYQAVPPLVQPAATPTTISSARLPEHADQVVDYRISVTLNTGTKELHGHERLRWRNRSSDRVADLWFHLYLNAFKNSRSTFLKESGGWLRGDRMATDGWGWIDISSLRLAGGSDLTAAQHFQAPDDGNEDDQTVMRVRLPQPVEPGASVTLEVDFVAKLPKVFARTGHDGDFYLVAQWFPKLGVYEPAGTRGRSTGGWNCHQFHADTEFYADYGHYLVDFTVPSRFVVGATGVQTSRTDNENGTTTYTYEQADVHDFAWTADPNYVEDRATFSATRDVTPEEYADVARLLGRTEDEVQLSDVEIILLLQPLHRPQAERYINAAKLAIKWYGLWYGRYPYRTLTVVDPAGVGAAGMEYPTFITGGTAFFFNYWPFDRIRLTEAVTVHEFGHQFWYGMVGNNEFEEAWLDEGINSYSEAKVMELGYGRDTSLVDFLGLELGELEEARLANGPGRRFDRVRQSAWTYLDGYGFYSYEKPELLLRTLENYLGKQTMARIMRTFQERWRFGHPTSDDFYAVANQVSGQDLGWFFGQAVEGTQVLDYEVSEVATRQVAAPMGYLDGADGRRLVGRSEPADEPATDEGVEPAQFQSTVVVRRLGDFVFPVEIAIKFAGRPVERVKWDGRDRWKKLNFLRPERLEWADVDPDRTIPLDVDWLNNGRRVEPDARAATKWSTEWLFAVEQVLATVGW